MFCSQVATLWNIVDYVGVNNSDKICHNQVAMLQGPVVQKPVILALG